jgi:hypothetical protein
MSKELFLLKMAVPYMSQTQKDGLKEKTLEGIKSETIRCFKKGMTIDQILAPSYKNKEFMFILQHLGIDSDKLRDLVEEYVKEVRDGKTT